MPVPSPCVDRCKVVAATGQCRGCGRTVAEITAWAEAGDDDRRAILARVAARKKATGAVGLGEGVSGGL